MNKELIQKDEEEKAIKFYKNYIENQEKELDWMYKQDEEYYRDEIEQKELLIKGFTTILNLIQKQDKIIDKFSKALVNCVGTCPIDYNDDFENDCENCQDTLEKCWIEFFKKEVEKDVKD